MGSKPGQLRHIVPPRLVNIVISPLTTAASQPVDNASVYTFERQLPLHFCKDVKTSACINPLRLSKGAEQDSADTGRGLA